MLGSSWVAAQLGASQNFFLSGIVGGGVQLGSLSTAATNRPIVPTPGDYDDGEIGGMMIGRGNRSTRRKPAPVPLCPPQTPMRSPCCVSMSPNRKKPKGIYSVIFPISTAATAVATICKYCCKVLVCNSDPLCLAWRCLHCPLHTASEQIWTQSLPEIEL
jgi:hypothetical protein